MTGFVGQRIGSGGLAVLFLFGFAILGGAQQSPQMQGETRVQFYLLSTVYIPAKKIPRHVVTNLIFYSDCPFDMAVLTVISCSSDARIAIDGAMPRRVTAGDQFVAYRSIAVTEGWIRWNLTVSTTGGPSLRYIDKYEARFVVNPVAPGGIRRSKMLFSWAAWWDWVVIHVRSFGDVVWSGRPYGGHSNLFNGDHVFSFSGIGRLGVTVRSSFEVSVSGNYNSLVEATMWKWRKN